MCWIFFFFFCNRLSVNRLGIRNDTNKTKVHETLNSAPDFKCTGQDHCLDTIRFKKPVFLAVTDLYGSEERLEYYG